MPPYEERFVVGSRVRVAGRAALETFKASWRYHNPITDQQLEAAGCLATVKAVGFYHGGDPLYELSEVPGLWHEQCLAAV